MNIDDVETLLEGVLAGLKARKQIAPLQQKLSELETANATLTAERNTLREENSSLKMRLYELSREHELSRQQLKDKQTDFDRKLADAQKQLNETRDDCQRQLNEQQAKFDWEFAAVCSELSDEKESFRQQLNDAQKDFDKQLAEAKATARQQLAEQRDNFMQEMREHKEEFDREMSNVCNELDEVRKAERAAKREADFFRETYGELDAAYKIYSSLDETTRFDLAGIFGAGDTAAGFFSGAVQESHLPQFWDYVSRHVDDLRLAKLFDFCFAAVNRGFREPPYIRLNVDRGAYFDDETMRRTSRSRQSGRVNRVLLRGYRYSSGNVVRQSVVELA